MLIFTTKGYLDEALLVKSVEVTDNDNEHTVATIYHLDGELVHRSVDIRLKRSVFASGELGKFD